MTTPRDPEPEVSTLVLTALNGEPLADHDIRGSVVAAAQSLAERSGVRIVHLTTTDTAISITIEGSTVEAVGFAGELRTITNTWFEHKFRDGPLWGTPRPT